MKFKSLPPFGITPFSALLMAIRRTGPKKLNAWLEKVGERIEVFYLPSYGPNN